MDFVHIKTFPRISKHKMKLSEHTYMEWRGLQSRLARRDFRPFPIHQFSSSHHAICTPLSHTNTKKCRFWQRSSCNVTAPNDELSTSLLISCQHIHSYRKGPNPSKPNHDSRMLRKGEGIPEFAQVQFSTIAPAPYPWRPSPVDLTPKRTGEVCQFEPIRSPPDH